MKLMDALYHRRAIRDYADKAVDQDLIRALIDAAIQAPNAMNRQSWSFVAVTNREVLDRCSERAKAFTLAALATNPHIAGLQEHLAAPAFNIFYNAPALIVICSTLSDPMAQQDCCLAAENLMLAAHGLSLGSCWIGLSEAWLNEPEGKAELKIPADHIAVAPIIVGYPKGEAAPVPRRAPHITWIEG